MSETTGIGVLYVAKDSDVGESPAKVLEHENDRFTVDTATSATDGYDRFTTSDYDCIVSDYQLPDQNGIEFLETIRADDPDLPFVLFTSEGSEEVASEAIAARVTDYVLKSDEQSLFSGLATRIEDAVDRYRTNTRETEDIQHSAVKERAIEEAPIGITISDPDKDDNPIVYANEAFEKLTGFSHSEMLNRNHRFLQGERTNPEPVAAMREAVDTNESVTTELRNYRKDGTEFWNQVKLIPIRDDSGTMTNFVGFQQDITEKKRQMRELARQNEHLENFIKIASHDIRSPLTVAQGKLELLRDEYESPHLDDIDHSLSRISTLLDKLVTLAQTGQGVIETTWVDLESVAKDAWKNIETDNMTLVIDGSCEIDADPQQLQQVFENLFQNSIDHSESAVTVRVGSLEVVPTSTRVQDSSYAGFYIADDGPGIPDDLQEDIFEWGVTTSDQNTGFGLAIVSQIVNAHGWDQSLTESYSGGARFEIRGSDFRESSAANL